MNENFLGLLLSYICASDKSIAVEDDFADRHLVALMHNELHYRSIWEMVSLVTVNSLNDFKACVSWCEQVENPTMLRKGSVVSVRFDVQPSTATSISLKTFFSKSSLEF